MKLYGFGSTVAGCYVFPTTDAEDDWTLTRDPVASAVGGRDGAADFYQDDNYNIVAATITKSFSLLPTKTAYAGTGTAGHGESESEIVGVGTRFLSEVSVGDVINIGAYSWTVTAVYDNTTLEVTGDDDEIEPEAFTIYPINYRMAAYPYAALAAPLAALRLATIAANESRLWAKMRDGSYRWCWAKCVIPSAPEKIDTRLRIPVTLEFYCREGLWYNETINTSTKTAAGAIAIYNAGDYPAVVSCDLTAGNAAVTAFSLTTTTPAQAWAFAGTLAATKHLIVNPATYTATNDGANAYSSLTITDKGNLWLSLPASTCRKTSAPADVTTITSAITGGGTGWTFTLSWYDTWIM